MSAYKDALKSGDRKGAVQMSDTEQMAWFCRDVLPVLCGAVGPVGPELVFDGAQAKGLTTLELNRLAVRDRAAIDDLMWGDA